MTIKTPTISWPTRDIWGAGRQPDGSFLWRLSEYATDAEIADLIRALEQLHEKEAGMAALRNIPAEIEHAIEQASRAGRTINEFEIMVAVYGREEVLQWSMKEGKRQRAFVRAVIAGTWPPGQRFKRELELKPQKTG